LEGGGGVIAFAVLEEFPGSVNGSSKGGEFEFMCVGKEMCAILFFIHLFQGGSHLVSLYLESGKEWIVPVFFCFSIDGVP